MGILGTLRNSKYACRGNSRLKQGKRRRMKAVCFQDVGQVEVRDLPEPAVLEPTDVIVKSRLAGLCGSDLHPFFGREIGLECGTVMGHEVVGEVVDRGDAVRQFDIGDSVFAPFSTSCGGCYFCQNQLPSRCVSGQLFGWVQDGRGLQGCQSEFVRIPLADGTLMKQPPGLSDVSALLLGDNFSTGYFCAEMAEVRSGGRYAVVGCGTVGLLSIVVARTIGAVHFCARPRRRPASAGGLAGCGRARLH